MFTGNAEFDKAPRLRTCMPSEQRVDGLVSVVNEAGIKRSQRSRAIGHDLSLECEPAECVHQVAEENWEWSIGVARTVLEPPLFVQSLFLQRREYVGQVPEVC